MKILIIVFLTVIINDENLGLSPGDGDDGIAGSETECVPLHRLQGKVIISDVKRDHSRE